MTATLTGMGDPPCARAPAVWSSDAETDQVAAAPFFGSGYAGQRHESWDICPQRTTTIQEDCMSTHTAAVEAAIGAASARLTAADQPLLELARVLAHQVDAAGPDGPGTRLAGTYLTVVRAVTARLGPLVDTGGGTVLVQMRAAHYRQPPRTKQRPAGSKR